MELELHGRAALVTAASRGIGFAVARRLASEGARVAIAARSPDAVSAAERELAAIGPEIVGVPTDLAVQDDVERLLDVALERFGEIDILVANTAGPRVGPALDFSLSDWRGAFDLMVAPVVSIVGRLVPGMSERGWGRVVFLTSTWVKQPRPGSLLSSAMRSALSAYSKQLALELGGSGVLVNQVLTGPVLTARTEAIIAHAAERDGISPDAVRARTVAEIPAGRYGTADELADVVAFLASARASYVNGTAIHVDGGQIKATL
jgi:3-oxoacyl-[acyl-carrier protein] reductase